MVLKRCSCGGKPELVLTGEQTKSKHGAGARVECTSCDRRTPTRKGDGAAERAMADWKTDHLFMRLPGTAVEN